MSSSESSSLAQVAPSGRRMWVVYVSKSTEGNFRIAKEQGVWGGRSETHIPKTVQRGDLVWFCVRAKARVKVPGFPRVSEAVLFDGELQEIWPAVVTGGHFRDTTPIWRGDNVYEYRFRFQIAGDVTRGVVVNTKTQPEGFVDGIRLSASNNGMADVKEAPVSPIHVPDAQAPVPPEPAQEPEPERAALNGKAFVDHLSKHVKARGLYFEDVVLRDLYLCLRSKPFVLFAGISGTGKTRLVRELKSAFGVGLTHVAVRPDWSDPSDLLGFTNLEGKFIPGELAVFLAHATLEPHRPWVLLLDEMNLARVEHYFADVLSIIESRGANGRSKEPLLRGAGKLWHDATDETSDVAVVRRALAQNDGKLYLEANMFITGTVNMDESTHPFSRKVLDRAFVMISPEVDLAQFPASEQTKPDRVRLEASALLPDYPNWTHLPDAFAPSRDRVVATLKAWNKELQPHELHVAYRVRDEVLAYVCRAVHEELLTFSHAMDLAFLHKVVPRIQGGEEVRGVLEALLTQCASAEEWPHCRRALERMLRTLDDRSFTGFWT